MGKANIRFNAVRPGFIETEIMEAFQEIVRYSSYIEKRHLETLANHTMSHTCKISLSPNQGGSLVSA